MNVTELLNQQPRRRIVLVGLLLLALVCAANRVVGPEFEFALFYLVPISFCTWFLGRAAGINVALVSTAVALVLARTGHKRFFYPQVFYWNTAASLVLYIFIVFMIGELKALYQREREWSRTDDLTRLRNRRAFFEALTAENSRARRYHLPLTLAYFDLDHFKQINDRWGHQVGDQLLVTVARVAQAQIRNTDFLARIGGDEFALLLPQTDAEAAALALHKIKKGLDDAMQQRRWPVTFSIGAITFQPPPESVAEIVSKADEVMYAAKSAGRDNVKIASFAA